MNVLIALVIGLVASAATSLPILSLLKKLKSNQTISAHVQEHAHKQGTPTMGGIMILVAVFVAGLVRWESSVISPLLVTFGFAIIGFVDDYVVPKMMPGTRGLGWKQKLLLEIIICAGACWLAGFHETVTIGVATFVILFFSNAYNFSDGIDGLAGTIGIALTLGVMLVSRDTGPLLPGLIGGLLVFLYYNRYPAKVFMGDVGALPIGALLGWYVFVFISHTRFDGPMPALGLFALSIVMLCELVPVPMQVFYYKLTKKRIFPKTPIHHSFQIAGWTENRIVALFSGVQMLVSALAILLTRGLPWT